jgi:ribonuclease R
MEEQLLEILKKERRALTVHEIEGALGLSSVDDLKELLKVLDKMEKDTKIYRTKHGNYMLFEDSNSRVGIIAVTTRGFGFVMQENGAEVKVLEDKLNGAAHKDKVIVNIIDKDSVPMLGEVIRIVERGVKQIVGSVFYKNGNIFIKPDDNKFNKIVKIDVNYYNNLVEGHKVVVKLLTPTKHEEYRGEIIKVIGHVNDPGVDILSIMAKYGINDEFSEKVMDDVQKVPSVVTEDDIKNRIKDPKQDLRNEIIFTIDGDDTKDIDDAISIKKLENNNYELGVHIADVSYYVKENSELDKEAAERGTSVYLADRVTPMLPHELSNGICSLNPNVERLALSCIMEIDSHGNVINYDIFDSIIKSRIQMTYKKVNLFLEEKIISEGYEEYVDKLSLMEELAGILRRNKENRGYIDFEIEEAKIIVNENGEAIDVQLRNRGTGEKLIEDFMIAANETIATQFYHMDYPLIYRIHGEPSEEKMNTFMRLVSILGYKVNANLKKLTPKVIQEVLNQLKDKKEFYILSSQMLRSMQKAIYDTKNIGHFGLASKIYCHFTSPIRRYPDLTVHRSIRKCFLEDNINVETIKTWEAKLPALAEHSSTMERAAIECEREVDDMKKAEYMLGHIGEEYEGIITGVMSFGFFIQLPNMIEGLVKMEDLSDDYYTYDESTFTLVGNKNKRGYRLGDSVNVIVKSASKEAHTIDFIVKK